MNKLKIVFIILTSILVSFVIWYSFTSDNNTEEKSLNNINKYAKVEDITYEKDKVNIYLFWGDGCPHCKEEYEYIYSINKKYSKYFNLYGFEVWEHKENAKLLEDISNKLGIKIKGVPFTIIGEKYYSGFSDITKKKIEKAIKSEYKNDYDVMKK